MKLLLRGDDLGLSKAVNYGIKDAYASGILKNIGLLGNMEDAQHGYNLICEHKDICLGLHVNLILGKPCADPIKIPHLVDENQSFISSKIRREEAKSGKDGFVYEEVYCEVMAQIERFQELSGRLPAYIDAHSVCTPTTDQAIDDAADAYGIAIRGHHSETATMKMIQKGYDLDAFYEQEKPNLDYFTKYLTYCDKVNVVVFHPGYVDMDVVKKSSLTMNRCKDTAMLLDPEVIDWIQSAAQLVTFSTM